MESITIKMEELKLEIEELKKDKSSICVQLKDNFLWFLNKNINYCKWKISTLKMLKR